MESLQFAYRGTIVQAATVHESDRSRDMPRSRHDEHRLPAGLVMPFVRALAILEAWTPQDRWLGTAELTARTGFPRTSVIRLCQALLQLGYLCLGATGPKYRLTAAVLGLGYATYSTAAVRKVARTYMQTYADECSLHVMLAARQDLTLRQLENCSTLAAPQTSTMLLGGSMELASTPAGWAFLAALPERDRVNLIEHVASVQPREWSRMRRRSYEGIAQVQQYGWCASPMESGNEIMIAAPLPLPDGTPMVLASVGLSSRVTRARVERELAPRLLAMSGGILQASSNELQ
ncbi:helix-turn-helix domain-containing protein [Variovorax paradoxus]|nr:helix-turn-helix domain-containing protein [Variovorax paradoxus]